MAARLLYGVVALVVVGSAVRVALAFGEYGVGYDIDSARIVADALRTPGQGPYPTGRWPYPPGFFPALWLADAAARETGLPFHGLVQLPAIAADAVLAWLAAWFLTERGRSARAALAGAALVALGPSFAIISGYHGQIDSVAILPACFGAVVWVRGGARRALIAGALIGVGAAIKTVPLFTVLALLPTARDRREALTLVGAAVAVPVVAILPWLVLDLRGTLRGLTFNRGVPGFGGLSALLQPELAYFWSAFDGPGPEVKPIVLALRDAQNVVVGAAVLVVGFLGLRRRTAPLPGLVAVWLTVLAVNPNFAYHYVIWTLPFLLLAGRLWSAAALQAGLLAPSILLYTHADKDGRVYWVLIELAWLGIVGLWLASLRARSSASE